jgi:hypothetical protein
LNTIDPFVFGDCFSSHTSPLLLRNGWWELDLGRCEATKQSPTTEAE